MAAKTKTAKKVAEQEEKHPVARIATVPDVSYFDDYIGRKITKTKTDFDVFDYAHRSNTNVLIEGPTGPGKTSAVMAWAAKNSKAFVSVSNNQGIEPSQLFGRYIPTPDGAFVWQDGPVTDVIRHGGVLLLNEINFMPERVSTVLFGLLDKRRQIELLDHKSEVITANSDLLIVADMNPDYEGTRPLNKAFRNRFAIQLQWGYDETVEKALVSSKTLLDLASRLRVQIANMEIETPVSTNMLMEFEVFAQDMDVDFAILNFLNHFSSDERSAVEVAVDAMRSNLEDDFRNGDAPQLEPESDEFVVEDDDPDPYAYVNEGDGEYDWLNNVS